jgi:hypothetical protein
MLESFVYASWTPNGEQLVHQGFDVGGPAFAPLFEGLDPEFVDDLVAVMANLPYALVVRTAVGQLSITEVMPTIERVLRRLTADIPVSASADATRR